MLNSIGSFVFAWYNVPFTLLLGLCLAFAALQLVGLGGDGDGDADAEVDGDADLDHDLDTDHDMDHDVTHDVDHDTDGDDASSIAWLAYLGVGKAPLLIVLLILFGTMGMVGWLLNSLAQSIFGVYPNIAFVAVLPASLIVATLTSARVTQFIGNTLPPVSTTATRSEALVTRKGIVISPYLDGKYGQVRLRDKGGTLISIFAITEHETLKRGDEVVLMSYDERQRRYVVTRAW